MWTFILRRITQKIVLYLLRATIYEKIGCTHQPTKILVVLALMGIVFYPKLKVTDAFDIEIS